jgi:hypothetical protein
LSSFEGLRAHDLENLRDNEVVAECALFVFGQMGSSNARDASGSSRWTYEPGETVTFRFEYEVFEPVPSLGLALYQGGRRLCA